ncbi:glycosyl transferase [Anaerosacchariphilus sp. NSJ-68]|uniref:Peptide O-xylosyltransferase n=2 Tax=Lachnospiraceae TaxID=186803 RepID=A0A923LBY5_9FIRM|nr:MULTISPECIES: beta-1,6-N-acetylglucosaminyltransferase [Lachnospiraceae]MBC5659384.1 glycosyl transferase [Anaerosacchariphilus hominis]MBC5697050.1 glycosyl transferase [Roseburia difficilis]
MNRHAYLIMAHNHFDFLKDLLLRLDDPRNDIYLHVDAAASDFHPGEFTNLLSSSRLFLTDRLRVHWGGYSQIAAELTLLRAASREHYLYYHLLSGSDLPLKSQEQIHTFFDTWSGKEFLAFDSLPVPVSVTERISLWHFFRESRFPLAEPLDHLLTLIQRLLHVNRLKKETFSVRKGPNWFSITDNFAQYVLQQEDWIQAHFRRSVCADELFLQTLAVNSPFRPHIYDEEGRTGSMANLRYVDWEGGNGNSPRTFQETDRDMLLAQPHLFARKFERDIFME